MNPDAVKVEDAARKIDRDLGDLSTDLLAGIPLLTYLRYDVDLHKESVRELNSSVTESKMIESLSEMDAPENMEVLPKLGVPAAELHVDSSDFEAKFDLAPS
jgi:hypothetical protein